MKTVKFNEAGVGKWAEDNTLLPQFEITEAGQEHLCSLELAVRIEGLGKGKIVDTPEPEKKAESEAEPKKESEKKEPAKEDKKKSEKKPAQKDKQNAESK